ncbi:MAG: UPF0175 family protein [Zoogloea sp.]|nr:UPF0175 family protein [Zoogloea sp.]
MQAFLQGGNERIAPGFDFVFHGKDVLPLAALLGFGLADVLLEALGVFHAAKEEHMKTFAARTLKRNAHKLIRRAEDGRLSVVMKNGSPVFVAVPFDAGVLREDVVTALAMHLFDEERVSLGKAARMAKLSVGEMTDALGRHGIAVIRTGADELQRSLVDFGEPKPG